MKANILLVLSLITCVVWTPLLGQNNELSAYTQGEGISYGNSISSFNMRGYIQPYVQSRFYNTDSANYGYNRFRMRRLRLRLSGDVLQGRFEYRLNLDLAGNSEDAEQTNQYLLDAFIAYKPNDKIKITIGQLTTPTDNRELRMGSQTLQFTERSRLTSAFATIREVGIFIDGNFRLNGSHYLRPSLAFTDGDGAGLKPANIGGFKYGGRIDYLPFGLFSAFGQFRQADLVGERTPKLVMGGYYSLNQGVSSRRGRESGTILYLDQNGEYALPDYTKFGFDMLFKFRGFSLYAEWVKATASVPTSIYQRVRVDGSTSTEFEVDGSQNVERYVKGRMMVGSGWNVQAGYVLPSRWSVDARITEINPEFDSFLNNTLFYNRPRYYTLGIGKYFDRNYSFRIQADYTWIEVGPNSRDVAGNAFSGRESLATLMMTYAF